MKFASLSFSAGLEWGSGRIQLTRSIGEVEEINRPPGQGAFGAMKGDTPTPIKRGPIGVGCDLKFSMDRPNFPERG